MKTKLIFTLTSLVLFLASCGSSGTQMPSAPAVSVETLTGNGEFVEAVTQLQAQITELSKIVSATLPGLTKRLDALEQKVDRQPAQITELSKAVSATLPNLTKRLDALDQKVDRLSSSSLSREASCSALEFEQLRGTVNKMMSSGTSYPVSFLSLQEITANLDVLEDRVDQVAGNSSSWDRHNLTIKDISSKVQEQEKSIDNLEQKLDRLSGSASSSSVSDIVRDISDLESMDSNFSRSVSDLKSEVSSLKSDISSLKSDLSSVKSSMR